MNTYNTKPNVIGGINCREITIEYSFGIIVIPLGTNSTSIGLEFISSEKNHQNE